MRRRRRFSLRATRRPPRLPFLPGRDPVARAPGAGGGLGGGRWTRGESPTSQRASRSRRRRLQRRWKRDLLKASLTRDDLARPALSALGAMTQGCSVLCRISSRALQEDVRAQPRPPAMPAPGHHWRQAWAKARVSWESHIRRGHDPQAWTPRVLGHRGAEWLSWQRLIGNASRYAPTHRC
ncbi:unnamed protein product [Prorocentrum cordatum]|uniref:Uncharacterized protein n=1 Tax=Prorocentrum cordatum TaxID=2364126 RepID=A0ABN9SY74_9DINO|nr:unnamed protein product [Polarella glacialis]